MATADAIFAFTNALRQQLEDAASAAEHAVIPVKLLQPHEVQDGLPDVGEGFSICVYRLSISTLHRNQPPRRDAQGRLFRPSLPVDLHCLLTPWSATCETQHRRLGWLLRHMETLSLMPAAQINRHLPQPSPFGERETVEISFDSMPSVDFFSLWDKFRARFPLSATYVARMVMIDSELSLAEARPVHVRNFELGPVVPAQ